MELLTLMKFTLKPEALQCSRCGTAPKPHKDGPHIYLCGAGGVVCGSCVHGHKATCVATHSSDCCRMLENIASRIEVKCACGVYVLYCKLKEHHRDCLDGKFCTSAWWKCRLDTKLVSCSYCNSRLRPPVLKPRYRDLFVCANCRCAVALKDDLANMVRCPDLEYLFKCMIVKTRVPYLQFEDDDKTNSAVPGNTIIVGKNNGKAPSKFETGKIVAEAVLKTSAYNNKAKIATPSGVQKTDEYESIRPLAGNSANIGKSKEKAPPKVREMDNHIVDSDEDECEEDSTDHSSGDSTDDSSDVQTEPFKTDSPPPRTPPKFGLK